MRDYLSGLESQISAHEAEKCRLLRGRPDALYGNLVVEFEASFPRKLKEATGQLQRYLAILRKNRETADTYFIPLATDGISFRVFAPTAGHALLKGDVNEVEIEQIEEFDLNRRSPVDFYYWLDRYFVRREERKPTAENFLEDFATDSPAFREAGGRWLEIAGRIQRDSDFKVIFDNWRKYIGFAYGSAVGDLPLFIRHTYLATLAKLIAYVRITDAKGAPTESETQEIVEGTYFEKQGILNFLEEDFFSWAARPAVFEETQRIVGRMVRLLFTYQLRELSEDVLKELYQRLVDPRDRHELGEYYTPDWLADRMCRHLLDDKGEAKVLDPSCGSGTFLYHAIQHKRRHLPATRQSLERILENVAGIDIHPLAVIISKINVLLGLGDLFQKRGGPVSIQVYLANSIRHPEKESFIGSGGIAAEKVILNDRVVLIPDVALSDPGSLDAAVRVAAEFAKAHKNSAKLSADAFSNLVRREAAALAKSDDVAQMLFGLAELLHEFIRKPEDSIWAYILKNQYKPTFLREQFDVVIGNPPWLSFRFIEKGDYQSYMKRLVVTECGLLEGAGHLITHLELGTLFFVRCARLYLNPKGRIGFVLPRSIFSADQHDRFRRSAMRGNVTLTEVWDLDTVTPLFSVPAAVAFGDLASEAAKVLPGEIVSGKLPRKNSSWIEAKDKLEFRPSKFHVVQQGERSYLSTSREKISTRQSYYQPYFKEGATIVPRNFWFVEFKTDSRLGINPQQPLVVTDPRAEAEAKVPYKGTGFEGAIESEFLYATLLSTDLLPFGHFDFRPVVLPMLEGSTGYRMIDGESARTRGYLRLAEWLDRAERTWVEKRKEKAKKSGAITWLNYRNKLTDQDPKAKYVVLYPKSATFLCAAVLPAQQIAHEIGSQQVTLRRMVADHVTYFFETESAREALYLASVLNSPTIDHLVKPMQARGLWGPRDIHKKVWELPIPEFDENDEKHNKLAETAASCETKVAKLLPGLSSAGSIGRARTMVRQALKHELGEIDGLVKALLK